MWVYWVCVTHHGFVRVLDPFFPNMEHGVNTFLRNVRNSIYETLLQPKRPKVGQDRLIISISGFATIYIVIVYAYLPKI